MDLKKEFRKIKIAMLEENAGVSLQSLRETLKNSPRRVKIREKKNKKSNPTI